MGFSDPRLMFDAIAPARFAALERFAAEQLPRLDLSAEAAELGLELAACLAAVADQRPFAVEADAVFAPFEGEWLGSDIHHSARAYRHIWYPTEIDAAGSFAGQKVLMLPLDAAQRPTYAYDFCELDRERFRITGLVGERAHRGYALPERALLWLAEERDGQVSVHLERVVADGQLYDIRGAVVAPSDDPGRAPEVRARSDWRYHRLRPGAVQPPA